MVGGHAFTSDHAFKDCVRLRKAPLHHIRFHTVPNLYRLYVYLHSLQLSCYLIFGYSYGFPNVNGFVQSSGCKALEFQKNAEQSN